MWIGHAAAHYPPRAFLRLHARLPTLVRCLWTHGDITVIIKFSGVCCVAPRTIDITIRVSAVVLFQTRPWVCHRGEDAVRVGFLGSPFLAGGASCSDGYFASIVFTNPNHAVWLRGGLHIWNLGDHGRLCSAPSCLRAFPQVAVFPPDTWVSGVTPRALVSIRVPAVVHFQTCIWELLWGLLMPVWGHRCPGLALFPCDGGGRCSPVALPIALIAFLDYRCLLW